MKRQLGVFCLTALALCGQASAQVYWTLNADNAVGGRRTSDNALVGVTASVTAWAANTASQTLVQSTAINYSGIGITHGAGETTASPQHAIDNDNYREMVLVTFTGGQVNLNSLSISWWDTDSDMTVMAYTGAGAPNLGTKNWNDLKAVGSGWSVIENYADVAGQPSDTQSTTNITAFSSYWLIGAYNSFVENSGWSDGNDFVKLKKLIGEVRLDIPGVPEPSSLALLGFALAGMGSVVRRRKA